MTSKRTTNKLFNLQTILLSLITLGVFLLIAYVVIDDLYESSMKNVDTKSVVPLKDDVTLNRENLLSRTNHERFLKHVPALTIDERLNASAQKKADDMNTNKYFGHVSPIDNRQGYEYVFDATNGECGFASENLNEGPSQSAASSITGWMNSPAHRDALLDPKYDLVGFGYSGDYVVQHFCQLNV